MRQHESMVHFPGRVVCIWVEDSQQRQEVNMKREEKKLQSAGKPLAVLEALKSSPKSAKAPTCLADEKG